VEIKLSEKGKIGKLLKSMKSDIDQPLSAILSLNTIAHTVGAIGVGALAEETFGSGNIRMFGYELPFSPEAVVAVAMTLAILILSEIIPKTLGATYWRKLTGFTVHSLSVIMIVMKPLVAMSRFITKRIKGTVHGQEISRADVAAMAKIGQRSGVFQPGESKIINNLMRFHKITAGAIMTPRTVVKVAEQDLSIESFYNENRNLVFSRVPIYEETLDDITGFILKDTLLESIINHKGDLLLKDIALPITIVNQSENIQQVFNHLMLERQQIALVIDEFGGMAGIVTMEDVIETLLGLEIVDEFDDTVDMQELARQNWENRARRIGLIEE
jgi:CBS domain containing-hemolysin-like protein